MAKNKDNNATFGMSGRVNQFVFRQRFGETVVSKVPVRTATFTEAQKNIHSIFKKASLYARSILQNAAIKLAYSKKAKRGQSPYNLALADYFKSPEIVSVDLAGLTAEAGGIITAMAIDNFRVESVKVKIEKPGGGLLEEGNAIQQSDGLTWIYTTTAAGANTSGNKITVTASDLPGNQTVGQKTI